MEWLRQSWGKTPISSSYPSTVQCMYTVLRSSVNNTQLVLIVDVIKEYQDQLSSNMAWMIIIFFCLRLSSFLYVAGHDCLTLPRSMNTNRPERGCAGAVWHNGDPSPTYCKGIHWNGTEGVFPWWSTCCFWNGNSCQKNDGKLYVPQFTRMDLNKRFLPKPMTTTG